MVLKELFSEAQNHLNDFFKTLDYGEAGKFFEKLKACKGIIFFSGVGKSALVANKIALTMTSTGTRALFLSPVEALHGDIGLISNEDILVLLSKSGETDELLNLIPFVRNKGATVLSMVGNPKSRLAKASHLFVNLPYGKELCPFNMAPTNSTTAQLIFGDCLAVALMKAKEFTLNDYAMNHPAGTIGKRIILKVKDLMLKDEQIPTCFPDSKLIDSLVELSNKRAGCVLVIDQNSKLLGIFTDGDLRRSLQRHGAEVLQQKMGSLMTVNSKTTHPEQLAWEAMKLMEADQKFPIMVLPVIDEAGVAVGLIKMHDILQSGL